MKEFNGYRSWNAWNVSLWINNDESLYRWARDLVKQFGYTEAVRIMAQDLAGQRTPDGARYNVTSIRTAIVRILD